MELLIHNINVSTVRRLALYLVTLISAEQSGVVSFLHDDESYSRLISNLQFHARLADSAQLVRKDCRKLSLADTVAVEDDTCRLEVCRSVELHQQVTYHRRELLDHLLPVWLQSNCR